MLLLERQKGATTAKRDKKEGSVLDLWFSGTPGCRRPPWQAIHYAKIAGRPGNPAFLTFAAGLLRSNRGDAPRSPRSGVLTPPAPPNELIYRPVEPVASLAPELDSPAMLFATGTTPLTRLSHRTVWRCTLSLSLAALFATGFSQVKL